MVKRWQASRGPLFAILAIVWAAFVVQWLVVVDGMVYEPASSKLAWRAAVIALPCAVTLALWCVHFLDHASSLAPGVIPPKQETDPEVAWYLAQRRPVALGARFADADGVRRAVRFSKDFRGQTVKTILPEALLHPEDPEGPVLADGSAPEFSAACWTVRHCKTCRVWRPPKASHCAVCGHCMARFDHHCPVVGACIAQRNTRWFIALLITGLACGAYFGGAVVRAAQVCDADTGVGRGKCHGTWEVIVLGIYAALLLYARARAAGRGGGVRELRAGGRHHQGAAGQEAARLRGGDGRRGEALERENGVREHWTRRQRRRRACVGRRRGGRVRRDVLRAGADTPEPPAHVARARAGRDMRRYRIKECGMTSELPRYTV